MKEMSNQLKWQKKQIAQGNCPNCGKPNPSEHYNCDTCHEKQLNRMRERMGNKPRGNDIA